ncbi:hypothetical protein CcaverHIS002_0608690 [Cutaneotrichosporon cavernicola]|uniref:CENP-V/GFA domain-containing protein n=1 Tax=Cutaneotrichosporon cavernicola TaxID=279322 RepID=A0AA48L9F9_9TREE|nr:uncharacterized protein CcaverHIS019_0608140 [Cutaneotrichosporon cavernicola]BEI86582.1 hypothetical protein CcaverHIS002_0608690 [Cutaneotrichosporon cavernicola]BEI94355.1 hypothetical protein CcaverHIS019_0608140 [Cutaneotrichosporon cavernicola]BEJ02132.1 hypothetical protein CcaverHIS631_0608140 [Cutaneotrichosporon cavernicola]BEJ09893.1 hypothetical protein CcaverHIS641_0608080 [Cutaneotrichosporon cavernicola]
MEGSCLCRGIKVRINAKPDAVHVCHCTDCRQFTGAIAAFLLPVSRDKVTITGYPSGYANKSDAGVTVKRYFCGNCGSSLYDIGGQETNMYYVHAGLFPSRTLPAPGKEIFLRSAEEWTIRYPGCKVSETEVKNLGP